MKEELLSQIKYDTNGLVPAIVQDANTNEVLMMAWMNAKSLRLTIELVRLGFGHAVGASCGTRARLRGISRAWLKSAWIVMRIRC